MYRPSAEDFEDIHVTAASAEPMPRPDHKSKKHSRPYGGSQCVAQRHRLSIDKLNAWAEVRSLEKVGG
ncbi:hypothetical protein D3C71_2158850 [compost metagenome]